MFNLLLITKTNNYECNVLTNYSTKLIHIYTSGIYAELYCPSFNCH